MKTKKFLMLIAAMLLSCTSAFAQSGNNNNPAKGDVNEDGTVDVADIVAVIDIMKTGGGTATVGYFYLGTTKPKAENYKTLQGAVTSFASIDDAVGTTASVAAGQTLYMLCPAEWVTGKSVALEDNSGNTVDFGDEKDATTIPSYVIYKTQVWNSADNVTLKTQVTYYWYIGQTNPADMGSIDPIVSDTSSPGWRLIGTNIPNYSSTNMLWDGDNNNIIFENRDYYYIAVPKQTIQLYNVLNGSVMDSYTTTINEITYYIYSCTTKARAFAFNIY